jgi:uncharacterized membrane protein YkgB
VGIVRGGHGVEFVCAIHFGACHRGAEHLYFYGAPAVAIGGLKFTAYEAAAIRPLVETSPLLSWAYALFDPQTFSTLLGVVELATALLLALAPALPLAGLCGGALAAGTFALTATFLITGPAWEPSLGGFPALSPAGGFLIKDLARISPRE